MKRNFFILISLIFLYQSMNAVFPFCSDCSRAGRKTYRSTAIVPNIRPILAEPANTIGELTGQGQGAMESVPFQRVLPSSDPSRFMRINVDPVTATNEIDFWGRQMSEHALFVHLGLEDPALKQEALNMHISLEKFRKKFNRNPNSIKVMDQILPLLKQERLFQMKVLRTLDAGKWIGWLYPTFVNHVTLELDYFVDKLNGIQYSPDEEVAFWNTINGDHASMTSHLLDPSEQVLCSQAKAMSDKFLQIPKNEKEMMIKISLMASKELDAFNKTAKAKGRAVKSIIHPVLLNHIIREGERSIQTLQSLGLYDQSVKFEQQLESQINEYQEPMNIEEELMDIEEPMDLD